MGDGATLEKEVRKLLRWRGWEVSDETMVGGKRVDVLATESHLGESITYALECKDYSDRLRRAQVAQIIADYGYLFTSGEVDRVFVVTRKGITPSADALISGTPGFRHVSLATLERTIIDFSEYASQLVESIESDHLVDYYQEPFDMEGDLVESVLRGWINGQTENAGLKSRLDPERPVALLAGYGMGKSSFARVFAGRLAREFGESNEASERRRIPILIELGRLAVEQSIEGLLGRVFTADFSVPGYSFSRFMDLNRAGRFVIILDGLDEMKQRQTWDEFVFNMKQIARLCQGDARLLVLGRPTAFASEHQRAVVLQGSSHVLGAPSYQEISLRRFRPGDVESFARQYLESSGIGSRAERDRWIGSLSSSLLHRDFRDLASRPVQIRMILELVPDHPEILSAADASSLYSAFIDHLIDRIVERELDKSARLAFSKAQRRDFAQRLAYWLWVDSQDSNFSFVDDIPRDLVVEIAELREPRFSEIQAAVRDLVLGSPVELAAGHRLTFPHRSIQEFLVSDECWRLLAAGSVEIADLSMRISSEVADFMTASAGASEDRLCLQLLSKAHGSLSAAAYRALAGRPSMENLLIGQVQRLTKLQARDGHLGAWTVLATGLIAEYGAHNHKLRPSMFEDIAGPHFGDSDERWHLTLLLAASLVGAVSWTTVSQTLSALLGLGEVIDFRHGNARSIDMSEVGESQYVAWVSGQARRKLHRDRGSEPALERAHTVEVEQDNLWEHVSVGVRTGGQPFVQTEDLRVIVRGAKTARVRRFSPRQVKIFRALAAAYDGKYLDLRSLRSLLKEELEGYAFIDHWSDDWASFRQATTFSERMRVPDKSRELLSACLAVRQVEGLAAERLTVT